MVKKLTKSVQLTAAERQALETYDNKFGYRKGCQAAGLIATTWFNILNTGSGRSDNIEKIRALLK